MDWLKDKKNQPIVAAILAVVIVGIIVVLYFTVFAGGGGSSTTASMPPDQAGMNPPGGMPGAMPPGPNAAPPGAPGAMLAATTPAAAAAPAATTATAAPATGTASTSAQPMLTWRGDPFLPVGYKPPRKGPKPNPPIRDLPIFHFQPPKPPIKPELIREPDQPIRRLAGVLLNGRVYALIESNGQTEIVQPGKPLKDGLAVVDRIEADKVVLKTTTKPARYLVVRLASSTNPATPTPTAGPTSPGGPMPPGMMPPGMPPMMPRPGAYPRRGRQ